jgi:hypothetical protein
MVRRVVLLLGLCAAAALPQQPDTNNRIPPFKPRFNLPPKMPWGDKLLPPRAEQGTEQPTAPRTSKPAVSKPCSVPLINVTPPARPYMPNIKPKTPVNDRMAIPPPAPACEEDREEESRR